MINMLRKGIKFSIQRVYFPLSYFESRHYGKRFNSIGKFESLTFQLRAIYFHTFDMSVYLIRCKIRHTHIIKKGEICQKPKSLVVWEGRPDFSFLFKNREIDRSQGRLVK